MYALHFFEGTGSKMTNRVLRGGSWNNNDNNCRLTNRNRNNPDNRNNNIGFRCVQDLALKLRPDLRCRTILQASRVLNPE